MKMNKKYDAATDNGNPDETPVRGLSRRDMLKSFAAAGFFATAGSGLLLGPQARAAEGAPKRGGHVMAALASSSTKDTLDPARGSTAIDYCRDFMFYNGLTEFDEHLKPQPCLAKSFDSPDGGQSWVFKLRDDVSFHDGKPLVPEDVIFSIMRQKKPETGSSIQPLLKEVAKVEKTGKHEVTVTLESANIEFPSLTAISHMLIVPAGTTNFSKGIGTGPFKCAEFAPGIRSIAERNPNYWKPGKPYLDSIEMVGIGDKSSRVNALMSGGVQMVNQINGRPILERIKQSPDTRLSAVNSGNYTDLIMRLDLPPGDRADFVEGMKYLLNRERMKQVLFDGYAEIANDQPLPSTNPYYFDGLPQRPYDPERAKSLFKKAGVAGAKLEVYASQAATSSVDMAMSLQAAANQAGLNLKVKRVPAEGYWSNYWAKRPVTFGNINPRPTANILFTELFTSNAPWNESHWKNPKFDQLVAASRKEVNEDKRMQMYADMQRLIHDSCGLGIPVFLYDLTGYSSKIGGMDRQIPLGSLMGYRFAENIWWKG